MSVSDSPDDLRVLVCASTGKAAFNVFGMTLHFSFRLPKNQRKRKLADLDNSTVSTLYTRLRNVRLIIIDESSMVSSNQLYQIDFRLRQIFGTDVDFGNIPIMVVGDFRQLPPVGGPYIFKPPSHLPTAELVGSHLWEMFKIYELEEIMRQKGDQRFCKALNNLGSGCLEPEDVALFNSREVNSKLKAPEEAINLFLTNKECEEFNQQMHKKLKTEGAISTAHDVIEGDLYKFSEVN